MRLTLVIASIAGLANAACPYMDGSSEVTERLEHSESTIHKREVQLDEEFLDSFTIDDSDSYLTTDAGGRIQDNQSLKAGERGPTLLEDFIFRQKIQHFDHERVCYVFLYSCPTLNETTGSRTRCPRSWRR